ncbi:MAG: glycosyl transferase [Nitrospira sp. SG-bin1]|nr:MAG: glycosyl transferase [Nitrospira sp. SG-bin1]
MSLNQSIESSTSPDILCLSHLRWNWVFQRPQHLLTRAAGKRRVFFVEEPVFDATSAPFMELTSPHSDVIVAVPRLPRDSNGAEIEAIQSRLLQSLLEEQAVRRYLLWYYTPMALPFSRDLTPLATIYDCMDQLAGFAGAPPEIFALERELLERCDLLFTGGLSLYEAKRTGHANAHCFPSSVDVEHFRRAREGVIDPGDQAPIPHPRIGYFGVIDERLDVNLIAAVAKLRSHWHFVFVGPTAKIDAGSLPQAANIHYLGSKQYQELPAYVGGWDVAWMPFARNQATRFISPTKTPEYLAAGKPVVSTSIRDVVRTYGDHGFARIADSPQDTVRAMQDSLLDDPHDRLIKVDSLLRNQSWDETWKRMDSLISEVSAGMPAVRS